MPLSPSSDERPWPVRMSKQRVFREECDASGYAPGCPKSPPCQHQPLSPYLLRLSSWSSDLHTILHYLRWDLFTNIDQYIHSSFNYVKISVIFKIYIFLAAKIEEVVPLYSMFQVHQKWNWNNKITNAKIINRLSISHSMHTKCQSSKQ